jgi:hypothetical protein
MIHPMRDQVALPTYIDWMVHRFRVHTELALHECQKWTLIRCRQF